jgi:hypothetical protein
MMIVLATSLGGQIHKYAFVRVSCVKYQKLLISILTSTFYRYIPEINFYPYK